MADQTFFQNLIAEVVSFFETIADVLGEDAARAAVIKDLGGNPDAAVGTLVFPTAPMDSIKNYRDASNPSAEADAAVVADVVAILDALASNIEAWATGEPVAAAEELFESFIDLMATNYVRLRWPRFFLIMQSVATLDEMTSTYGAGTSSVGRFWTSLKTLLEFLFAPGRTLEQLNPAADPNVQSPLLNHRAVDGIFRLGATVLGFMHVTQKWKDITGDMLAGWDAPGLDLDSAQPARAADIISNQMVSFSFAPEIGDFEDDPETAKPLLLSLAYVPALLPAEGLFVAFGGHLERRGRDQRPVDVLGQDPQRRRRRRADRQPVPRQRPVRRRQLRRQRRLCLAPRRGHGAQLLDPAPDRHAPRHRPARRRPASLTGSGADDARVDERLGVRPRRLRQRQLRAQAARRRAAAPAVQHHARLRQWPRADLRVQPALGEPERSGRAELAARR